MGYFQVRYDSRVVNYDCRGFIRLATGLDDVDDGGRFQKAWPFDPEKTNDSWPQNGLA